MEIIPPVDNIFPYKGVLLVFIVVKYVWEQYVNLRELSRSLKPALPSHLHDGEGISPQIQSQFILSQGLCFDRLAFDMLALSIKMSFDCMCIMTNMLPFIWNQMHVLLPFLNPDSQFHRAIGFALIQGFVWKAYHVPLTAYRTFVIQKKYGATNKTLDLFAYDLVVEGVLVIFIFPPIIYGYLRIVELGGSHFHVYLQIFVLSITIVLTEIHPRFIAPLFNKFHPLIDLTVLESVSKLCKSIDFPVEKIFWMNGSCPVASPNHWGHWTRTRTLGKMALFSTATSLHVYSADDQQAQGEALTLFYIFSSFMHNSEVLLSFGFTHRSVFVSTALFFHLFEPLTAVFEVLALVLNRKFEFQADQFACRIGYGADLREALLKLYRDELIQAEPDWLYSWVKYSHPTIHERIKHIDQIIKQQNCE